ncbi:hypothetical protein [Actinoplanes derwentensis]|uniref:Uncharacterized protein n=1 Tax=Actinoplanes derwentensis TaxID=113562 RepID=A0A1H1WEU4_9ACTN|nr:hypothetical protein [Actinoplanes derwentensis]GID87417.1 hypothetical protein Ade03nite_63410 [Actinoplanes derwentensis]SDS95908.1 hypothetical protein SAMN04489716_2091 [Actinoplanes derwentensis]
MRVLALWLLATWCAECVWGGFTLADYPVVVLFLGPLYGGAAVLIREVVRRRGGGWPSMVLLAAVFGLVQAGLVDQSLFDRAALEGTEFAAQGEVAAATLVPGLEFNAGQLFEFVGNHVWLSICAPIAVVEACARPGVRHGPWLSTRTITVTSVLFVAAVLVNWSDSGHVLSPAQVLFVVVTAAALVTAALWWRASPPRQGPLSGPGPLVLGGVVLAAHLGSWFYGTGWLALGLRVVTLAVVVAVVVRWSRSAADVLAVWGAGLVVAAAGAFLSPPYAAAAPWLMLVSDVFGALFVVSLLVLAFCRSGGRGPDARLLSRPAPGASS